MAERNFLPQFMVRSKAYSTARKPPGGDTNDIFGLEARQRESNVAIYTDRRRKNIASPDDKFLKRCHETEDIPSPRFKSGRKLRRSLSESRASSGDPTLRTPPLATGKENIGCHFRKSLSPASKISSEGKKLDESEDENDDETSTHKKQKARDPVTGDDVDSSARSKLEDSTNFTTDENPEPVQLKPPRLACIRVRQPPGGKSSIVF